MKAKKLKDLKAGDRMYLYDWTDTTPITVVRKKREGQQMTVWLKWDDDEKECFGPALGWSCVYYSKKWGEEIFTSDFNKALHRQMIRERIQDLKDMVDKL